MFARSSSIVGSLVVAMGIVARSAGPAAAQQALENLERQIAPPPATTLKLTPPPSTSVPAMEPGYLGILADDADEPGRGVRLVEVIAGAPAAQAGLRAGDYVTSIDGKTVKNLEELATLLTGQPLGKTLTLIVRRGNEAQRVDVRLGKRPPPDERLHSNFGRIAPNDTGRVATAQPVETLPHPTVPGTSAAPASPGGGLLGVRAMPVTPEMQLMLSLPEARGALVVEVHEGSAAKSAGIPLEAVITSINGRRIDSPQQLAEIVAQLGLGADVELSYFRYGQMYQKKLTLGGPGIAENPLRGSTATPLPSASTGDPTPLLLPGPTTTPLPPITPRAVVDEENEALRARVRQLEARVAELESQRAKQSSTPQP